jgi:hypothetical protein
MNDHPTFEETYPKYQFSELVRLGMALAAWTVRKIRRAEARRQDAASVPSADPGLHAH